MASFAQDPQQGNDPNYIFWSRAPREQPRGSQAGKIMGDTVGNLIHEGAETADTYEKNDLQHKIYDVVDDARSNFTNALEGIRDIQRGTPNQSNPLDVLPPQGVNPPQEVKQGIQKVEGLQNSLGSGKINKLQYWQYLIPHLQELRDTHQGYRQYIDQEVSRIAGGNPANEMMSSLIEQINQGQERRNQADQRAYSLSSRMVEDGDPTGAALYHGYQQGKVPLEVVMDQAAKSFSYKRTLEMHRLEIMDRQTKVSELAEGRAERAEQESKDEAQAHKIIDNNTTKILNTPYMVAGMTVTPNKIFETIDDAARNPGKYDEKFLQGLIPVVVGLKAKIDAANRSDFAFAGLTSVKPEAVEAARTLSYKIIDDHLKMLGDPDKFPLALMHASWNKALTEQDVWAAKTDANTGDTFRRLGVLKNIGGEQLANIAAPLSNPNFTGHMWTYGLNNSLKMWGQEYINPDYGKDPFTFGKAVQQTNNDLPAKAVPGMVKSYLNNANYIMNKDIPEENRVNLARSFFAPTEENRNILSSFNEASKWQVFGQLTGPTMTKDMVKLGNKHPEIFQNYMDTTHELFRQLVKDNVVPQLRQAEVEYGHGSSETEYAARHGQETAVRQPIHYKWDADSGRLSLTPNSLSFIKKQNPDTWQRLPLIQSLGKFNAALRNMGHIATAAGADINTLMLEILQDQGVSVDPTTQEALLKVAHAIANSQEVPDINKEIEEDVSRNK